MTLVSMENVVRRSWDSLPMPDTVIARVNALRQGQPNDLDFLDINNRPIGELEITLVDTGEAPLCLLFKIWFQTHDSSR